jgi:hypothetical protein
MGRECCRGHYGTKTQPSRRIDRWENNKKELTREEKEDGRGVSTRKRKGGLEGNG